MGRPSNAIPEPGESLADLHPGLAEEWDYDRNANPPSYYKQYSNIKAHWICRVNPNHRWLAVINPRAKHGVGCPFCAGKGLTNEERIAELMIVHGDKFDYSKYIYKSTHAKSTVICKLHGEFQVSHANHRAGKGCPVCARKSVSDEQRISEFKAVHGEKYDYSKYKHLKNDGKSTIICRVHGEFGMPSWVHLRGSGCPKCSGKGLSKGEWITKFREVHGDRYDYSEFSYKSSREASTIICPDHGRFEQSANKHLGGHGCHACGGYNITGESMLERFREAHGDYYDYSEFVYAKSHEKATIICPRHGKFQQSPSSHASGFGCRKCGAEAMSESRTLEQSTVIMLFQEIHGDLYDYSLVEYESNLSPVAIICPEHGVFHQSPKAHKKGSGCPSCAVGGIDPNAEIFLYSMEILGPSGTWWWKVGVSKDPARRAGQIQRSLSGAGLPLTVEVRETVHYEMAKEALEVEKTLLESSTMRAWSIEKFDGSTELFESDPLRFAKSSGIVS